MVAMHELAHCKQMNHSRAFWAVRDAYVAEMKGLWARGYTGEGVWGRGRELGMGQFEVRGEVWDEVGMPERLCGGVFRTRGRGKRRRVTAAVAAAANQQLTYVEREKRRVERKFGVGGEKVGEDQGVKFFLDGGKSIAGKPRVAGSNRGRELRAQAALIRLGAQKVEDQVVKKEEGKVKKEEMEEGDWEEFEDEDAGRDDAVDYDGAKMKDGEGKVMVKVCEDEDVDDVHVKQEMDELTDLWSIPEVSKTTDKYKTQPTNRKLGRPGENIYSAGTGSHVKKIEQSSEKSQINGTDDMRSKLNTVHQNGSIVDALKRQEKKAKAKK